MVIKITGTSSKEELTRNHEMIVLFSELYKFIIFLSTIKVSIYVKTWSEIEYRHSVIRASSRESMSSVSDEDINQTSMIKK